MLNYIDFFDFSNIVYSDVKIHLKMCCYSTMSNHNDIILFICTTLWYSVLKINVGNQHFCILS